MTSVTVAACSLDLSVRHDNAATFVRNFVARTKDHWQQGADIVLFPEYSWIGLAPFMAEPFEISTFAHWFWENIWPQLQAAFEGTEKMAVLGTVPYEGADGITNRALIVKDGQFLFQDKLALTPWEDTMVAGKELQVIVFNGIKSVVLTCLDIEMPFLAETLKQLKDIDLILVPSATDTVIGAERIARCASARAVELNAAVVTCAVRGGVENNDFMDINTGRTALYLPAQAAYRQVLRENEGIIQDNGDESTLYTIDMDVLRHCRIQREETNPAIIFPRDSLVIHTV